MKSDKIKTYVADILKELDVDLEDPNFKDTPNRVAKLFRHFFRGHNSNEVAAIMSKVFPSENDQMVVVKDMECFGMCPHHLVPIIYNVSIGYIPKGTVLGLSKLARLSIALSSYPKLQEDFTKEIADELEKGLSPLGIIVFVQGSHMCMRSRGVEQNSETITSDIRGVMKLNPAAKSEFFELINYKK